MLWYVPLSLFLPVVFPLPACSTSHERTSVSSHLNETLPGNFTACEALVESHSQLHTFVEGTRVP